ncbi:MAG TPA: tRNA glutamyl-Q(34) synthetase GluQRS [Burkholderiales bacterium]|nr:tRNA glutamyl-Q(34) synthetase GluQRS [Burkholderiales bacterium]
MYTGRFAPSPSGPLHFGSLVAALASWLDARAARGRWLVRIEDLDRPRVQPGADAAILGTLVRLGLRWDGEVLYQSRREALYREALARLRERTYWCACTRREIADSSLGLAIDGARIYPGTCREGIAAGKEARALRLRVGADEIRFVDRVQGPQAQLLARDVGDFVLCRADGLIAYQLAVVVDDAAQGVTDVVRGADLLDSTARQVHLQRLLGLPTPRYLHVPVALSEGGEKLSKQTDAPPIDAARPAEALAAALAFLGQPSATSLDQAIEQWDVSLIPAQRGRAPAR